MKQLNLFENSDRSPLRPRFETMRMDREGLITWKQSIFEHQQQVRQQKPPQQSTLFEMRSPKLIFITLNSSQTTTVGYLPYLAHNWTAMMGY